MHTFILLEINANQILFPFNFSNKHNVSKQSLKKDYEIQKNMKTYYNLLQLKMWMVNLINLNLMDIHLTCSQNSIFFLICVLFTIFVNLLCKS